MAFFDELGKKISVTGQNVMQKAKGMADITNLKSQINEEQKKIDKIANMVKKSIDESIEARELSKKARIKVLQ